MFWQTKQKLFMERVNKPIGYWECIQETNAFVKGADIVIYLVSVDRSWLILYTGLNINSSGRDVYVPSS